MVISGTLSLRLVCQLLVMGFFLHGMVISGTMSIWWANWVIGDYFHGMVISGTVRR